MFHIDDKNHVSGFTITKERKFFSNTSAVFGVEFHFETNTIGFLVRYYLICGILVCLISSISFMIKPSIVPGRAGLLVTLFLVLANFFSLAQVLYILYKIKLLTLKFMLIKWWHRIILGDIWMPWLFISSLAWFSFRSLWFIMAFCSI